MPATYFEANDTNNLEEKAAQLSIRNLAVIAHVDHGKTTLSDALLHKAGLMARNRVGDQTTGRSLDTLKDEKERGITIKSAPITLHLQVSSAATTVLWGNNDTTTTDEPDVDIYVGNLPRGLEREELVTFLESTDHSSDRRAESIVVQHWNSHRGFALVRVKQSLARSLCRDADLNLAGRPLVVEVAGNDALSLLKTLCEAHGLDLPSISVLRIDEDETYSSVATWPSLGGVLIHSPDTYSSQKEARQAVAQECLRFWYQQKNDHAVVPSETAPAAAEENGDNDAHTDNHLSDNSVVPLVLNLIDSPGHIEFNAEVTAALRVSDGALLVVDAVEGKSAQTDNVLRQALQEGVVPVLMINKVDRLIIDKQLSPKDIYDRMQRVVEDINNFIATHQLSQFPDLRVSLEAGTVCFGSGFFGWSCSIDSFLHRHHKDGASTREIRAARRALAKRENFIKHILRPVVQMHRACAVLPSLSCDDGMKQRSMSETVEVVREILARVLPGGTSRVRLVDADKDSSTMRPRKLLKNAMMAWLPAAEALVDMVASHVPSPVQAQALRAPLLYSGDIEEDSGQGIANCDPTAPTVVFVSKMSPSPMGKRLLAFGRVFSGTVRPGDQLRALRTDGTEGVTKVSRVLLYGIAGRTQSIPCAEAGQLVALEGVDEALNKAGTLTSSADGKAIRHMEMAVTPIFQRSVRPRNKNQLAKMVSTLRRLVDADSTALFFLDKETQQYILAGSGELHIEVLVSSLLQDAGIEVELSDPIVAYREGVQKDSELLWPRALTNTTESTLELRRC